jgi:hypothetical protein
MTNLILGTLAAIQFSPRAQLRLLAMDYSVTIMTFPSRNETDDNRMAQHNDGRSNGVEGRFW